MGVHVLAVLLAAFAARGVLGKSAVSLDQSGNFVMTSSAKNGTCLCRGIDLIGLFVC
jgi:hypothetical protein